MEISITKDLGAIRGEALLRIDQSFARIRARLDANADVHAAKLGEARMLLSVGASNRPTPMLVLEAEATRSSLIALAEAVIAKAAIAADRIARLEIGRQAAQAAIRTAATPAAITTIVSEIESRECL